MTRQEKLFLFFTVIAAMAICGDYAMIRPTSNALFLTHFSAKAYPWVWLAIVPLNFFVIYFYNRFLPKVGPLRMFYTLLFTTIAVNVSSGFWGSRFPPLLFFQYAWKDIYILLMLKQLWSIVHSTIPPEKSKYIYGCIYGMGTVGAILGSLIPGLLVFSLGSEQILLLTCPIYLLLLFAYTMAFKRSAAGQVVFARDLTSNPKPKEAFSLIRRSPLLMTALLLVIFMQASAGLMEYRFNTYLELHVLEKDFRTAYCGRLTSLINLLSLVLQFIGGFLMIRVFGLRGSHFFIPILLCSSALLSIALPSFAMICFSYVLFKAVDFSIFGVAREMLYVSLPLDAKFRSKAIIDVFAYRTSKALVSLLLLFFQGIATSNLLPIASTASVVIFLFWIAAVAFLFRPSINTARISG